MTRFVPVTVLVLLVLQARGRVARAESVMLPGGTTLAFNRLFLHEDGSEGFGWLEDCGSFFGGTRCKDE